MKSLKELEKHIANGINVTACSKCGRSGNECPGKLCKWQFGEELAREIMKHPAFSESDKETK